MFENFKSILNIIKNNWFLITLALLVFAIVYFYFEPPVSQEVGERTAQKIEAEEIEAEVNPINDEEITKHLDSSFSHKGILRDVTGGNKIHQYQTSGLANGRVLIKYIEPKNNEEENVENVENVENEENEKNEEEDGDDKNNKSILLATIINIPEVDERYNYYGWLVNTEEEKYISLGEFEFTESRIINAIRTNEDLTKFDRFVVTLQSNESYVGATTHVLEGKISKD